MANYESSYTGSWHDDQFIKAEVFDKIYPIGSIYMSVNSTSPATLFGGTWSQINNTFLVAQGSDYTAGSTGGTISHNHNVTSNDHALTVAEMPGHSGHITPMSGGGAYFLSSSVLTSYGSVGRGWQVLAGNEAHPYHVTTGGNTAHNHGTSTSTTESNLPPYLAVYMWQRTA